MESHDDSCFGTPGSRPPCKWNLLSCVSMSLSINTIYSCVMDGLLAMRKVYLWLFSFWLGLLGCCLLFLVTVLVNVVSSPLGEGRDLLVLEPSYNLVVGWYTERCCLLAAVTTIRISQHRRNSELIVCPPEKNNGYAGRGP